MFKPIHSLCVLIILIPIINGHGDWIHSSSGITVNRTNAIKSNSNNIFVSTQDSGIFTSSDSGNQWSPSNNGQPRHWVISLLIDNWNILAGTDKGVYISNDNGQNWMQKSTGLTETVNGELLGVYALATLGAHMYAGTSVKGIFHSSNSGEFWTHKSIGLDSAESIDDIVVMDTLLFIATGANGVYISENLGESWVKRNNGLSSVSIKCLYVKGDTLYAGSVGAGIFLTYDKGQNWYAINNGLEALSDKSVYSITSFENNIFACIGKKVYMLPNGTPTWKPVNSGLPTIIFGYQLHVFGQKLFLTTQDSGVWQRLLPEMITPNVPKLVSPISGGTGVPCPVTFSWNVAKYALSYAIQVSNSKNFTSLALNQSNVVDTLLSSATLLFNTKYYWRVNATNLAGTSDWSLIDSFTTSTSSNILLGASSFENILFLTANHLNYSLLKNSLVNISLYDIKGRIIKKLVDGYLPAGSYSFRIPNREIANGHIFILFSTDNKQITEKILLLRK